MTPEYAALQLLKLGPLTWEEFRQSTGWKPDKAKATMDALHKTGQVTFAPATTGEPGRYWITEQLVEWRKARDERG